MHIRGLLVLVLFASAVALQGLSVAAQEKPMIEEVKARGVLHAGVKDDAPYLGFVDEKGNLAGFEIDLITDIAKRLGVKLELEPVKGSTRVQLLQQKRLDLLIATVSHYRSRDRVVDFTIPYLYTPQTLLVKKSSGIRSLADLAGKRVGVDAAAGALKKIPQIQPKATMQTFQSWPDAFFALERGTVDAVATDNILLAGLRVAARKPDDYVLLKESGSYGGGYYAIAVRENDSKSRDELNFLLQDQWKDGTWQRAFDRWLGKDSKLQLTLADFDNFKMPVWDE
jgi:polar amino acid transport system substrate-binding protein